MTTTSDGVDRIVVFHDGGLVVSVSIPTLDELRAACANPHIDPRDSAVAIAATLLAYIDRLSERMAEAERRIRSLENDSLSSWGNK